MDHFFIAGVNGIIDILARMLTPAKLNGSKWLECWSGSWSGMAVGGAGCIFTGCFAKASSETSSEIWGALIGIVVFGGGTDKVAAGGTYRFTADGILAAWAFSVESEVVYVYGTMECRVCHNSTNWNTSKITFTFSKTSFDI